MMKIEGYVRLIATDIFTGEVYKTDFKKNIITSACKYALIRVMAGVGAKSNEGKITYGAVGIGTSTPNITDTILNNEIARAPVSLSSADGLSLRLRVFFSTEIANDNLKEFGWFGEDATSEKDTGTLFNRILIDFNKTSSITLTIEQIINFV